MCCVLFYLMCFLPDVFLPDVFCYLMFSTIFSSWYTIYVTMIVVGSPLNHIDVTATTTTTKIWLWTPEAHWRRDVLKRSHGQPIIDISGSLFVFLDLLAKLLNCFLLFILYPWTVILDTRMSAPGSWVTYFIKLLCFICLRVGHMTSILSCLLTRPWQITLYFMHHSNHLTTIIWYVIIDTCWILWGQWEVHSWLYFDPELHIYNYGIYNNLLLNASRSPMTLTCHLYYYDLANIQFLPGVYTVYYFICIFYLQSPTTSKRSRFDMFICLYYFYIYWFITQSPIIPPKGHALWCYTFTCMF